MSLSNINRNKNSEKNQNTEKENNEDEDINDLASIKNLYPGLSGEEKISKNLLISNEENSTFKRKKASLLMANNENLGTLSDLFLKELIKKPCTLSRDKIIEVMTKFIQKSPLLEKFQKDSEKEVENNELSSMGAKLLSYMELKKGQILFRIGDNGDRFYFILSGRVSILKLKEINNVQMTYFEYIEYCMYLISQKEYYIFNKVKNRNMKILSINSESEVISIYKIFFLKKLNEAISRDLITNIKSLLDYLKTYGFKLQDFNIKLSRLEEIENDELLKPEHKREEWDEYLKEKCKPSFSDLMTYEYYKDIFKKDFSQKKSYTCFIYKPFLFLGKGLFFGDFALDSDINKRNATIRAEENTILAFMKSEDYINIFAPGRKMEKMMQINFIYSNYFFKNINLKLFEKSYFHLFSPHEYFRNYELFNFGADLESLILLKEGKVTLELKASITDLHDLIKYLWIHIEENKFYQSLNHAQKASIITPSDEKRVKEYIEDPFFMKLKMNGNKFMEEINKKKIFQVYIFAEKEIIGLEEFYLGLPYIMRGSVVGNKISCYRIDTESFRNILYQERQIVYNYVRSSINKILSLIERMQNLKINNIKIIKNKIDNENSDSNTINSVTGLGKQYTLNKIDYKNPINAIKINLSPSSQLMSIKKNKLIKKLNISNSNNSLDNNTNFSSAQFNKEESSLQKYNISLKKINENKKSNLNSKEDIPSVYDNNTSNTKNENKNSISINSNKKSTRNNIKLQLNYQRNLSYSNFIEKIKSNMKLNHNPLSIIDKINKTSQTNSLIKKKISIHYSPAFNNRNYLFNKKISKHLLDKQNNNEHKINGILLGSNNHQLKKIKSNSIDFLIKNYKDKDDNNSNIDSNFSSINRSENEKNKKSELFKDIKHFYKGIKNRGYSSLLRNKKSNTILNRKNKRKYISDPYISMPKSVDNKYIIEKNKLYQKQVKLPLIKDNNNKNLSQSCL